MVKIKRSLRDPMFRFRKGEKIFFDEVGRGRVKAVFVRDAKGSNVIVRELRKKRGIKKGVTLISRRKK